MRIILLLHIVLLVVVSYLCGWADRVSKFSFTSVSQSAVAISIAVIAVYMEVRRKC